MLTCIRIPGSVRSTCGPGSRQFTCGSTQTGHHPPAAFAVAMARVNAFWPIATVLEMDGAMGPMSAGSGAVAYRSQENLGLFPPISGLGLPGPMGAQCGWATCVPGRRGTPNMITRGLKTLPGSMELQREVAVSSEFWCRLRLHVAWCMLLACSQTRKPTLHRPNNRINWLKYYTLPLRDPNPNLWARGHMWTQEWVQNGC